MGKVLDWNAIAKVNFDDNRRKQLGIMTGKKAFQKAFNDMKKAEEALQKRQEVEPLLKNALLNHMVNRLPIKTRMPIQNPTETMGGTDPTEDDGFYNSSPSASSESAMNKSFQEVMETIPAGLELIYKAWDRQLGQWLFKGSNGREYAIYEKSVIMFKGQAIENPGLFGLLYNTNLLDTLGD